MRPVLATLLGTIVLAGACTTETSELETNCVPNQNVFCRCPDGTASTQRCREGGMSFDACVCDDTGSAPRPDDDDPEVPPPDEDGRPLLASCESPADCATTVCSSDGYCTSPCYKPSDCPYPKAECVALEGKGRCIPSCGSDIDCSTFGGSCQEAMAVDSWIVHVCQ
jgi:hypothetical protein